MTKTVNGIHNGGSPDPTAYQDVEIILRPNPERSEETDTVGDVTSYYYTMLFLHSGNRRLAANPEGSLELVTNSVLTTDNFLTQALIDMRNKENKGTLPFFLKTRPTPLLHIQMSVKLDTAAASATNRNRPISKACLPVHLVTEILRKLCDD